MDDIIDKIKQKLISLKITCYLQANWWSVIKITHKIVTLDKNIVIQGLLLIQRLVNNKILTLQTTICNLYLQRQICTINFDDFVYTSSNSYSWYNFTQLSFLTSDNNTVVMYPTMHSLKLMDENIEQNYKNEFMVTTFDYYIYEYMLSICHPCILVLMYAIFLSSLLVYYTIEDKNIKQLYINFFGNHNLSIMQSNLQTLKFDKLGKITNQECISILNGVILSEAKIRQLNNFYML